ncbi:hypothetical protein TWF696_003148 [Orbilia brochopaga]|uniref:Uncharacterized protein n=1 Tax=Orbilia brochopaga TaxID=3140254 RepID=A0AAV9U1V2_9PEZI
MSGNYGYDGMGPPAPPPPPQSQISPRPPAYRQGAQQQAYYTQENSEAPAWRIPYHETEVLISTVETTTTSPIRTHYSGNLSRSSSSRQPENYAVDSSGLPENHAVSPSRKPENYAVDSAYHNYSTETTVGPDDRVPSHNMVAEDRGPNETTEQVSDGMNEGATYLWGGPVNFYETSRPNYPPPTSRETVEQDRYNDGLRTIKPPSPPKPEPEPLEEKIAIDYSDYFMPSFHPSSNSQTYSEKKPAPAPPSSSYGTYEYNNAPRPVAPNSQPVPPSFYDPGLRPVAPNSHPIRPPSSSSFYDNGSRPVAPTHTLSDPFPISVEQERYSADQANLRESQYPEPVNMGGSDPFFQPPSVSYPSYRRVARRPNEDCDVKLDANGLPSLSGLLGPATSPQPPRRSFDASDEKRFYPSNYNNSSVSLLSTHSENIPPSSRYTSNTGGLRPTPSYASIRPDTDIRPCGGGTGGGGGGGGKTGIPPPPTRYFSQRVGDNKISQLAQERKMDYVVSEINRKDALHRAIQDESRRYGY